jgi:hypothetical protein
LKRALPFAQCYELCRPFFQAQANVTFSLLLAEFLDFLVHIVYGLMLFLYCALLFNTFALVEEVFENKYQK